MKLSDWTCERIQSLGLQQQLDLARQLSSNLLQSRVLLGRCLLTMERNRAYEEVGNSSLMHYALLELGLDERETRETLRVARKLEGLPLLTDAVENASISWSKLRTVLTRATPDNEAFWLEQAQILNVRALERLVRRAGKGSGEATGQPEFVKLELMLPIEVMEVLQKAFRNYSQEEGRALSVVDALEYLAAESLSGAFPDEKIRQKLRAEARRDIEARREADSWPLPAVENDGGEAPEAPWEAVAAALSECSQGSAFQLVKNTRVIPWENTLLHFNEESRLLTTPQRREILRRDGYRCSVPGCPHYLWLQVHHVVFYCRGGATVPENLVAVCQRCHGHIHRGLLQVRGEAPRGLRWFDRQGRELGTNPPGPPTIEPICFEQELLAWLDLHSGEIPGAVTIPVVII